MKTAMTVADDSINNINAILTSFSIGAKCSAFKQVGANLFFDLQLQPNVKVKDISRFGDELSLALRAPGRPSFKVLHDQGVVQMQFVSNRLVPLKLFDCFTNVGVPKGDLVCLLGEKIDGATIWMDLMTNPHMLVSGTTGSGKSVLLHNIIANILNYNDADIYLVDPKMIEFSAYKDLGIQVYHTYDETMELVSNLIEVMEDRYERIKFGCDPKSLKPILLIIDEFADLSLQDKHWEFYDRICRLAQKSRSAKISIILATQRPGVDIVNGSIKANFPARIACRVASNVDSRVILDAPGAEHLLGKGDALLRDSERYLERFQVAYTNAEEVCRTFSV